MEASPQYKIYEGTKYIGAFKRAADAAVLLSVLGVGTSVRLGHAKRDTLLAVTEQNQNTLCGNYNLIEDRILKAQLNRQAFKAACARITSPRFSWAAKLMVESIERTRHGENGNEDA